MFFCFLDFLISCIIGLIFGFRFVFVETAAPYQVEVVALSEKQMEYGQRKFEEAFDKWVEYKKTGKTTGVRAKGFAPDGAKIL